MKQFKNSEINGILHHEMNSLILKNKTCAKIRQLTWPSVNILTVSFVFDTIKIKNFGKTQHFPNWN